MEEVDVLVVGAGPAGSMAAKTAAEGGLNVLLIEEHGKIGEPVQCAEGINKFLFEDTGIKKNNKFIRQKIRGTKICFYDEVYELKNDQWSGYTIDRKIFDRYLAENAKKAGAEVRTNTTAICMTDKGRKRLVTIRNNEDDSLIEASVVVGAGGFSCQVGRWAGIRRQWRITEFCKCLEYEAYNLNLQESDRFHLGFGEEFPDGYGWVFPTGKKTANIGVGVDPKCNTEKALRYYINEYPFVKDLIGGKYSIKNIRGGGIPMIGPLPDDEIVADGILLVGDAAGIVDPITGEGITPSMLSGIAAGETIVEAGRKRMFKKDILKKYIEEYRNKQYVGKFPLGEDLDFLLSIKKIFFSIFSSKKIKKEMREEFILAIELDDVVEAKRIIQSIRINK